MPTKEDLLLNGPNYNREFCSLFDSSKKMTKDKYDIWCDTYCSLTTKMMRRKFGFGDVNFYIGHLSKFYKNKYLFCIIEIWQDRKFLHTMTIIDNKYVVHSFWNKFPLRITPITEEWMTNFKNTQWNKICEVDDWDFQSCHAIIRIPPITNR